MAVIRSIGRVTNPRLYRWAGMAFGLLILAATYGQEATRRGTDTDAGGAYPRLPGAVTSAPNDLDANSLFDIKKLFPPLPRDRNAAPLYLDAFFEFGNEMAICFPTGPETERRRQAASDRMKQHFELDQALFKDPKAVPNPAIDGVIKLYETGFRKLAEAQRRDHCIFETDLGPGALLPHIQAARQVTRIASLKVRRKLDRGDFDGAIRDVESVLRMARDLQPRGAMITQMVVVAINQVVDIDMVPKILSATGLRVKHCDQLLKLLITHESKSIDGYSEGLRMAYLAIRITMRDLVLRQRVLAEQLRLKAGESVVKALLPKWDPGLVDFAKSFPVDADAQVARTSAAKLTIKVRELGRYHGALLELATKPHAERIARATALKMVGDNDILSRIVALLTPSLEPATRAIARAAASHRATECLVAVRRWQLGHRGLPGDLKSAIQGSPLKAVPIDPYDDKPMRLTVIDGQPVVYSVGRDGKDDGGQIDSDRDQRPSGDLIYRLSPAGR